MIEKIALCVGCGARKLGSDDKSDWASFSCSFNGHKAPTACLECWTRAMTDPVWFDRLLRAETRKVEIVFCNGCQKNMSCKDQLSMRRRLLNINYKAHEERMLEWMFDQNPRTISIRGIRTPRFRDLGFSVIGTKWPT